MQFSQIHRHLLAQLSFAPKNEALLAGYTTSYLQTLEIHSLSLQGFLAHDAQW